MWRILAIVVFLAVILPIYGQEKGPQLGSDQNRAESKEEPPKSTQTATCTVEDNGTTIKRKWSDAKPESYFKRLASPENAPNIGLFFVGLGAIIAALLTLRAINRQADIANRTLIAQFRPKVIVRSFTLTRNVTYSDWPDGTKTFIVDSWTIALQVVNVGNTPSHIQDGCSISARWVERSRDGYQPIQSESFGGFSLKGGEEKIINLVIQERGSHLSTRLEISEIQVAREHKPQTQFLQAIGTICYLDDDETRRKTGFSRMWDAGTKRFAASDDPEVEYQD